MTDCTRRPFGGTAFRGCVMALGLTVAACATVPGLDVFAVNAAKSTLQFTRGQLARIWVISPNALVMAQRGGRGEAEQIIGLQNETTLEGDNFLWMRAHHEPVNSRFRLNNLIERIGGVPRPFRTLDNRDLLSGSDSMGTYFWQEYRSGAQVNCVVAFRRISRGARALPQGTDALDLFLRNCVNGTIEKALTPIRDSRIGLSTLAAANTAPGTVRNLSPLAGPRQ